jgi:8-oxo-dGTP diphosphatase
MAEETKQFFACGFLYDPTRDAVFLHHRDGNTKWAPNKWAFFGGNSEEGETPTECLLRELEEEIGLTLSEDEVTFLRDYFAPHAGVQRHIFYAVRDDDKSTLRLGEGAGFDWVPLSDIDAYDLTDMTKDDLDYFSKNFRESLRKETQQTI